MLLGTNMSVYFREPASKAELSVMEEKGRPIVSVRMNVRGL